MNSLRAGEYKSNLSGILEYKSYNPKKLPIEIEIDSELQDLLKKAYEKLEILNSIEDDGTIENQMIRKEVFFSNKVETEKIYDNIFNEYELDAIKCGIERLKSFPLSNRLIMEVHQVLMNNKKYSGEFRRSQNWVGEPGSTIKTAVFIPPNVEDMITSMNNLEIYMNDCEDNQDFLIKAAFIHYQLDSITPFVEGNSKLLRIITELFLIDRKVINKAFIAMSSYIERDLLQYYARMKMVRDTGDFEQWVKFFIKLVINAVEDAIKTIKKLKILKIDYLDKIGENEELKETYKKFENELVIKTSLNENIQKLIDLCIVNEINEGMYSLEKYMDELKIWL